MPGQHLWGGPLFALILEQTPNVLIQLGNWGTAPHPSMWHCLLQRAWEGPGSGCGDTHPSNSDCFPPQSTPVLCCVGTYSHTPFKSRTTSLSGLVGAGYHRDQDTLVCVGSPRTSNPQDTAGYEGGRAGRGQATLSPRLSPCISRDVVPLFT